MRKLSMEMSVHRVVHKSTELERAREWQSANVLGRVSYLVFLDHEVLVDDLHGEIFTGIDLLHQSYL